MTAERAAQLQFSTGDVVVDRVLRGYIGAFEAAFPGRLRCFVLAGGYAEGTATPLSDIDGGPVFRGDHPLSEAEFWRAHALIRACGDLARIHLDAGIGYDDQLYTWRDTGDVWVARGAVERRFYVKLAYRVLWGEEFREPILLPPVEFWARACFCSPPHHYGVPFFMAATRDRAHGNGEAFRPLVYPLDYPDRDDAFFGYAAAPLTARDGTVHLTTRALVRTVLGGANAMVAWKARRFVASKADVAATYRDHIGGPWADFVAAIDRTCRVELGYLRPADSAGQARLRALCRELPAFENHILKQHRAFLLEELSGAASDASWLPAELAGWLLDVSPDEVRDLGDAGRVPTAMRASHPCYAARPCLERWAAAMLGRVCYPHDPEIHDALTRLAHGDTGPISDTARASLGAVAEAVA